MPYRNETAGELPRTQALFTGAVEPAAAQDRHDSFIGMTTAELAAPGNLTRTKPLLLAAWRVYRIKTETIVAAKAAESFAATLFRVGFSCRATILDCYIKSAIRSARAAMVFEGFKPIASGIMAPSAT